MLALKGDTAEEELRGARDALSKLGVVETSVVQVGEGVVDPLSTVVRVGGWGEPRRCAFRGREPRRRRPLRAGGQGRSPTPLRALRSTEAV